MSTYPKMSRDECQICWIRVEQCVILHKVTPFYNLNVFTFKLCLPHMDDSLSRLKSCFKLLLQISRTMAYGAFVLDD